MNATNLAIAVGTGAPRPAGTTRAAVRVSPKIDSEGGNGYRILAWLRLYWLMVLFCGSLIAAPMAYLAWTILPSKFESYALLRVASSPFSVSNSKDPQRSRTDFTTYLKTNSQLIKNEFVLNKALSTIVDGSRISDLATIQEQKNPFQFLDDELVVSFQEGSEIIRLTMKGHNAEDIRKIVNAVQLAYMEEVIEKEIKERQDDLIVVEKTLGKLQDTLNQKSGKGNDALLPVGAVVPAEPRPFPALGQPAIAIPPAALPESIRKLFVGELVKRVMLLHEQAHDMPLSIASQKSRVETLEKQMQSLTTGAPSKEILDEVDRDPEVQFLATREGAFRRKYNKDRNTYQNPDAPTILASLAEADKMAEQLKQTRIKKAYEKELAKRQGKAGDFGVQYEDAIRKLGELETRFAKDQKRLMEAEQEMAKLPPDPVTLTLVKAEEKRHEDSKRLINTDASLVEVDDLIFRLIAGHAATLRLDISSPKRVRVLQTASTPMQRDTRKQILGSAFAGMFGFALIAFGAIAYETKVQKLCGVADFRSTAPMPVVGVIPWQPDASRDSAKRTDMLEAIDKLRAYVTQTWLSRGATVVSVTSPIGDEGKAFTAFHLANSLAQGGFKTLLVDFDLRKPTMHPLANVPNGVGVCELLRGEADFRNTIHALPSGLHFVSAGQWSEAARMAACGGRLEALLNRLKEPFDCVILHGHSLLTAAEAVEVSRRCDVVLLCTLNRETRLPMVKKASERIATMEIPFSGIVYLGATPQEALC